jgi:thiol-disulfide isomerase/thioredoxin
MNTGFLALLASCVLSVLCLSPATAMDWDLVIPKTIKPAPDMPYVDETGKNYTVRDNKGKLTAVHFWATWCVPCIAELPELDGAAKAYGAQGFKVIAISLDGENAMPQVKQFLAEHKITSLTPYLDNDNQSFKAANTLGLPTTIMIDAEGNEIARVAGPLDWKSQPVRAFIETHL